MTPRNRSVQKAFALLRAFRDPDEWVTCSELSRRAQLSEGCGYRLIQTLQDIGAVARGADGRYRTGLLLLSLSHMVAVNECLRMAARDIMSSLADRLNLTIQLARLEEGMVTQVAIVSTPDACQVQTCPRALSGLYGSALGKVLLSSISRRALHDFLEEGELASTPHIFLDKGALLAELEEVKIYGYAVDSHEFQTGITSVAVPVRDSEDHTIAAMSVADRSDRMSFQRQLELRKSLKAAADDLSRKVFHASTLRGFVTPVSAGVGK